MNNVDVIGIENAIKLIEMNGSTCFAVYTDFKQNRVPIYKHLGKQNAKAIELFRELANSLERNEYDVIVWTDKENDLDDEKKIRFRYFNDNLKQGLSGSENIVNSTFNIDKELKVLELQFEIKLKNSEIERLKEELKETNDYVNELELELDKLANELNKKQNFLSEKILDKISEKTETKPALSDNISKKELIKELIKTLSQNFSENELNKFLNFLKKDIKKAKNLLNLI